MTRPRTEKFYRFDDIPKYRRWVKQRDRALEDLHTRAQFETSDVVRDMLHHAYLSSQAQFYGMKQGHSMSIDWFEHGMKPAFAKGAHELFKIITDLRRRSYVLARSSESEIISQIKRQGKTTIDKVKLHAVMQKPSLAGGNVMHRISMYCDRLRRKIASYAQAAALTAKNEKDFANDVASMFPKARRISVPRRILKPQLMEADQNIGKKTSISADNIDDQSWQDMLDNYNSEYVPKTRGPEFSIGEPETTDGNVWYAWEFERDLTNEFVQAVRDGQIDAANENGITDFVWIAVLDDRTDSCCVWRDGLLVSEIEEQLDDHEDDDEGCSDGPGLTPPIHFNCRCTLAPATADIPEKPDVGTEEFDEWLNS